MGCAAIVFFLSISFVKEKGKKIIYLILGSLALYAMFMSGTRGAIIVPLAGMVIYLIASKNVKAIVTGSIFLLAVYSFFAFTYIGDGNMMIRRMRTAFHPNKDASYLVRKQNQEILKGYLKNKPFGEGLGLSGGDNKKLTYRLTTSIPNDSWYVKIWVETGVVGLILYIVIFVVVIGNCLYVLITKIKNREVKGILTAMLCGVFGLLVSAYGNPFFGQFPTMIIAFTFLAINLNGEKIDKQYTEAHSEYQLKT